jgi:GNAT superfamily N-acetyltransferase
MSQKHPLCTPAGPIQMAQAQPADLDTVLSILEEVAQWLVAKGIDQWQPGSFSRQALAEHIDHGEVYLARRDGEPVGTLMLQWANPVIWGDMPDDAGYVHRLAIRRIVAGQGLGRQLLQWAETTVAATGRRYLRLDCMAENAALNAYYLQAGFTYRGQKQGRNWKASLYEKRVGRTEQEVPTMRSAGDENDFTAEAAEGRRGG